MRLPLAASAFAVSVVAAACSSNPAGPPTTRTYGFATLVGAGDIGWCGSTAPEATARLLDRIPGTVFTTGDNAYLDGSAANFRDCYEPNWGRHKARTRPSTGNHDYYTPNASAYFAYFGENAGPAGRGYYSYDLEAWHIVSLDSSQSMSAGSAQWNWLRQDLDTSSRSCTAAYWHVPLFSSGTVHGSNDSVRDVWRLLYEAGAEIVINGHEHLYERFAPMTPDGAADYSTGIRQFTVGTGGAPLYDFGPRHPNSEAGGKVYGVLQLTLHTIGYTWEFVPIEGEAFRDSGSGVCH